MTYGALKHTIFSLLGIDAAEEAQEGSAASRLSDALPFAVDSAAKKASLHLKRTVLTETLSFRKGTVGVQTEVPDMAFGVKCIMKNGRLCGPESFALIGKNLIFFEDGEGDFEVSFYAFPPSLSEDADEDTELFYDALTAEAVAYGAAGALCHMVYPADMTRYMRLMTEYDERLSLSAVRMDEKAIGNTFFKRRGGTP